MRPSRTNLQLDDFMRSPSASREPPLILCVDDDPSGLATLQVFLKNEGYDVITAKNGQDALDKFNSQPVDAVVLDYGRTGMVVGIRAALKMKLLNPHVPRLLFTAEPKAPQAEEAFDAVITKREGLEALAAILRPVIKRSGMSPIAIRRSPRYSVEMPIVILADHSGELEKYRGFATNIGEGGIGGQVKAALAPGERVLLEGDPISGWAPRWSHMLRFAIATVRITDSRFSISLRSNGRN